MADGAAPLLFPFDGARFADLCQEVFEAAARTQSALLRLQRAALDRDERAMIRELAAMADGVSEQAGAAHEIYEHVHVAPAEDADDKAWAES